MDEMIEILNVAFHRNGVGGVPFHVVIFHDHEVNETMIATIFDDESNCYCAVYCIRLLSEHKITFGENSWRGDTYKDRIMPLLSEYIQKQEQ